MSFLTDTVTIPVWLLILLIGAIVPHLVKWYKVFMRYKRGDIAREEQAREERDNLIMMKLRTIKKSAAPARTVSDVAKEKSREKKTDILHVLMAMASEGDKGMLLKAIADHMNISTTKVQHAMSQLIDKNLVEEVTGVSGTKYYLTDVGKKYCRKKGFIKS